MLSPLEVSHATGARQPRFRRDTHQSHCFTGRLRRCEPPPPQNVFIQAMCLYGAACPTLSSAGRSAAAGPKCKKQLFTHPHPGTPAEPAPRAAPRLPKAACAGRRRFAPPRRPNREQLNPRNRPPRGEVSPCTTQSHLQMPAAGRGAVHHLVHRNGSAWHRRAGRVQMLCCPTVRVPSEVVAENFSAGAPGSATPPTGRHKYPHRPSLSNPDSEANADSSSLQGK